MFRSRQIGLIAVLLVVSFFGRTRGGERPNVVMAFADDWGQYASAYAKLRPGGISDAVQTPNFDKVAEQGVLFTRAFVSAPSCTPCRSSLLSGQHFWRCGRGAILQGAIWDPAIPSYPLLLEESGYRIGHTYKVWSPGTPADAPHGGAQRRFVQGGRRFNGFSQVAMAGPDREERKQELLDEVRQNVRSFLDADDDAQLDGESPFCYWLGPTNVHRKWIAGSGKELWGIDPDSLKGKLPPFLPDVEVVRQDVADYLGEVAAFDAALGVLIEELQRVGEYDNTILVVSGDHGAPGFPRGKCNLYDFGTQVPLAIRWPQGIEHPGRVVDDFVSLPDLAPTFLEAAGLQPPATMTAKSLVSVLESKESGQVDPDRDAVFTGRERHVARARTNFLPYPQRAIRTDEYLYIVNFEPDRWPMGTAPGFGAPTGPMPDVQQLTENTFGAFGDLDASPTKAWVVTHGKESPEFFEYAFAKRPKYELYNVKEDEHCLENLAESVESTDVRRSLHERLMAELKKTGDPRVSDNILFESGPYVAEAPRKKPNAKRPGGKGK